MEKSLKRVIIGITGASGSVLAEKAIRYLASRDDCALSIVITENAKKVFAHETGVDFDDFFVGLDPVNEPKIYDNNDMFAPIASGSNHYDCMFVLPCSMATLAKMANGVGDTLLTRAADVMLKERRCLVVTPRESPVSSIHLQNMLTLSGAGAIIVPPVPAFYGKHIDIDGVYCGIVGRVLAAGGIENDLYVKWKQD